MNLKPKYDLEFFCPGALFLLLRVFTKCPWGLSAGTWPGSTVMKVASWIVPFFDRQSIDILLTADFLPDQRQFLVLNLVIPENTRSWIDPESFRESQKISETKYGHLLVVQSHADTHTLAEERVT
jgi:hypothetical protein